MTTTSCPLCDGDRARTVTISPPHLAPDRGERFHWVRCRECGLVRLADMPRGGALDAYYGPGYLPHRGPEAWGRWAPLVRLAERRRDRLRVEWARRAVAEAGDAGLCGICGERDAAATSGEPRAGTGGPGGDGRYGRDDGSSGEPGSEELPSDLRVLDVGCGRPTFLRALVKAAGWHGTGIDTSDAGWRDDGAGAWAGLDLRVGRVEDADFDPGSFHLVTLWHVLEHVPAPRPFLERLHDVTGPGGVLVVEVPDHASLARRLQGESWIGYDTPRHAVAYEPGTLNRMLAETGWRVKQLRRWGTLDPWVLWWLGRQVGRGRTLEGPLEKDFLPFLAGKILTWPVAALQRWLPLGAMTAVARRRDD